MDFLEKIIQAKQKEIEGMPLEKLEERRQRPSLYESIRNNPTRMHVIAEVKRASPSKGIINDDVDILAQATSYEKAGASAISVLTDSEFFKGNISDLKEVSEVVNVPLLCKDFIFSKKQLIRAKNAGASIVLLIVAALPEIELRELFKQATQLGLEVLVETHNEEELIIAENLGATLIGVNNRDLKTFEVTIETSVRLAPTKKDVVYISESGFKTVEDVKQVTNNFHAVLVGETLMRSSNVADKVTELQVKRL